MHPFLFPGMRMGWGETWLAKSMQPVCLYRNVALQFPDEQWCLVLAKVDTFMNNKKCVKQCERVQQSTAMSSN